MSIFYASIPHFPVALARRDRAALSDRPLVLLGSGGRVVDASSEAAACGVTSGLTSHVAQVRCPEAHLMEADVVRCQEAREELLDVLKLPVGKDGFFNEIHPKLRPVETVVDGVYIAGAAQGPKNLPESIASALSAASKSAALLKKGFVDLEPYVAEIDPNRCDGCWECLDVCPYEAIERKLIEDREVAQVNASLCKGSGACVPSCPVSAIDLAGYSNSQIRAMIEAFA